MKHRILRKGYDSQEIFSTVSLEETNFDPNYLELEITAGITAVVDQTRQWKRKLSFYINSERWVFSYQLMILELVTQHLAISKIYQLTL